MIKFNRYLLPALCALCSTPFAANSATYYSGQAYQSPQQRYNAAGASPMGYNQPQSPYAANQQARQSTPYNNYYTGTPQYQQYQQRPGQAPQQRAPAPGQASDKSQKGFYMSAGAAYESAVWQFDLKDAGSVLSYDNVTWNTIDLNAGYGFDAGDVGLKLDAGVKFGFQAAESTMVDDDISNGGLPGHFYYEDVDDDGYFGLGDIVLGETRVKALSIGKSSGGSLFGYNVGLGLTDVFKVGNVRITPNVGWRSLSYKLKTNRNNGISIDAANCITVPGSNEEQCAPLIIEILDGGNGDLHVIWDTDELTIGGGIIDTGNTYFYHQPGTSHSYKVDWAGPYLAFDLDYPINANNAVQGRLEVGLPSYKATGDQAYRPDWQHPRSVEDSAGIGSAYHIGAGGNWLTALSDTISLSLGVTYDFYSIAGADAKTFLDKAQFDEWLAGGWITNDYYEYVKEVCPNWVCEDKKEVNSFYRSLGVRVGLSARF